MARLRQLPQLYLRGALANETMKHLTPEERDNIGQLTTELVNSPLLSGHKHEFIAQLGQTIGGDYHDDRTAAEIEFRVAIWRALVYLLHHTDYSYSCRACKATSYHTQRGKPKSFDRRYPVCLNCQKVRIVTPGDTKFKRGQYVKFETLQNAIRPGLINQPTHESAIIAIRGERKVQDHHAVLGDPDQTSKFFGEFIWNYFRQHLRENEIKFHAKGQLEIIGPADKIAVEEALSVLASNKYPHTYQAAANPHNGLYHIQTDLDVASHDVIKSLLALRIKYNRLAVVLVCGDHDITVKEARGHVESVSAFVVKPQVVTMQTKSLRIDDTQEESSSIIDTCFNQIVEGKTMQEDGIAEFERNDLLAAIRAALPDGAQKVMDILSQTGDTWQRFVVPPATINGPRGPRASTVAAKTRQTLKVDPADRAPRDSHIADFLGVTKGQVKQWTNDIKVQCMVHGLIEV